MPPSRKVPPLGRAGRSQPSTPRHYEAEFKLVYDGVEPVAEHQITERYIALLEAMIRESPELWMWSHRRWKHKKPADYDMRHSRDTETHNIPEA